MKKIISYTLLAISLCGYSTLLAQDPQTNLNKYWLYRERMKNFVVVGDCHGCSIPAQTRDVSGTLNYYDELANDGYYIGTLATEYALLKQSGQNTDNTEKELYYALQALNRLDEYAEYYWQELNTNAFSSGGTFTPDPSGTNNINGFLIRGDAAYKDVYSFYNSTVLVDPQYLSEVVGGVKNEDALNSSLVPPLDSTAADFVIHTYNYPDRALHITGAVQDGITMTGGAPIEESQDQIVHLLQGLALVVKCVDDNANYNNLPFTEPTPTKYIRQEAINITDRLVGWIISNNYTIVNPVTGTCVTGILNPIPLNPCSIFTNPGGGNAVALSEGLAEAKYCIDNKFTSSYYFDNTSTFPLAPLAYFPIWYTGGTTTTGENLKFYQILFAIDNYSYQNPAWVLLGNTPTNSAEFTNLLLQVLWGNGQCANSIPNEISYDKYECFLNAGPCRGDNAFDGNFEWSNEGQFELYGANNSGTVFSDEFSGVDWAYYFNLYCLANPCYLQNSGITYSAISPKTLLQTDLVKTGTGVSPATGNPVPCLEKDTKNFYASNSISAGGIGGYTGYEITNDPVKGNPQPVSPANVTMVAGNYVDLQPGFEANYNSIFNAYTDPSLSSFTCTDETTAITNCENCVAHVNDEEQNVIEIADAVASTYYNIYNPVDGGLGIYEKKSPFKVYKVVNNETFVSTGHVLFKISYDGGTGQNMFRITKNKTLYLPEGGDIFLLGSQVFSASITDIAYSSDGYTYIGFDDGKFLKIMGTGGTGNDMFNITETSADFSPDLTDGFKNYYVGDQTFETGVSAIRIINNAIYVAAGQDLLKAGGADGLGFGGTGHNMFNITTKDIGNEAFNYGTTPNKYWLGDFRFQTSSGVIANNIVSMEYIGSMLFIGLSDGSVLQAYPTGSGYNMFSLQNNYYPFGDCCGGGYYIGSQQFNCGIAYDFYYLGGYLFVPLTDGRILKENGTGGTGQNMFCLNTDNCSNFSDQGCGHYAGDDGFGGIVTGMVYNGSSTFISFDNGRLLNVNGLGGTGHYMFNVNEISRGFTSPQNSGSYIDFIGCEAFDLPITDIESFGNGFMYIALGDGKLVKVAFPGGTGLNMFALSDDGGCMSNYCETDYLLGCQDFYGLGADKPVRPQSDSTNASKNPSAVSNGLKIQPNPSKGTFTVFADESMLNSQLSNYNLQVTDPLGNVIYTKNNIAEPQVEINLSSVAQGVYFVKIHYLNGSDYTKRLVIIK